MREETQGPMDYGDTILTNAAGKDIVSRPLTKPLKTTSQAQMANFVVSNVSKNKEKAVEVLSLLNSDPELLNGLVYGVEGKYGKRLATRKSSCLMATNPKCTWVLGILVTTRSSTLRNPSQMI